MKKQGKKCETKVPKFVFIVTLGSVQRVKYVTTGGFMPKAEKKNCNLQYVNLDEFDSVIQTDVKVTHSNSLCGKESQKGA